MLSSSDLWAYGQRKGGREREGGREGGEREGGREGEMENRVKSSNIQERVHSNSQYSHRELCSI